jgi:hypothetical protein
VLREGSPGGHYAYGERPLREEILQEFQHEGQVAAVISRNSYGSLILNTPNVFFADIDLRPRSLLSALRDGLSRLIGRPRPSQEQEIVQRVAQITDTTPGLGMRLYRTCNGFRCLAISETFAPTADSTGQLLDRLGSDPLYVKLCRTQECFRARLSPKHWRCGIPRPPSRFPWPDPQSEQAYRDWEATYQDKSQSYSTCAFIGEFGTSNIAPAVKTVVTIHDRIACRGDGPLA